MEIRYNTFSDEVFIDMPRKEACVLLNCFDKVMRGSSTAEQRIIVRNFMHRFGSLLQDI